MRPDDATVLDILNASKLAVEFTAGMDKAAFLNDLKTGEPEREAALMPGKTITGQILLPSDADEAVGWTCPVIEEWNEELGRYVRLPIEED